MATKREMSKERASAAILNAAASEFAELGYNGTTIRSIAAKANVASGLVCTYFESKEKLLHAIINKYNLEKIYEGSEENDPYKVFCIYLNHVRKLQKNDPLQFSLHLRIANTSSFPDSIYEMMKKGFEESALKTAILTAQKNGQLSGGDAFSIFKILSCSVYVLFNQYVAIGAEAPHNDAILSIIGYRRKTGTVHSEDLLDYDQSMNIADYMISNASTAYYCDLSNRTGRIINRSAIKHENILDLFGSFDKGVPYFVDNFVHPDDKERVLFFLEPENIKEALSKSSSVTFSYRDISPTAAGTYRGILIRGEDENHAWLIFFNITDELNTQQKNILGDEEFKLKNELAQKTAITNFFLSGFSTAYYCNIKTGEVTVLHASTNSAYSPSNEVLTYSEAISEYANSFVHPDDRMIVIRKLEPSYIRGKLENASEFNISFRIISDSVPCIFRCSVIRGEDEDHVCIGFMDVSKEVLREQEQEKATELTNAFLAEYEAVFLASVDDGSYKVISAKKELSEVFDGKGSLFAASDLFFNTMVHPADKERMDRERIHTGESGNKFEIGESNVIEFRCRTGSEYSWYHSKLTRISRDKILVGFKECTGEVLSRIVDAKMIGEYDAIYFVDLETDRILPAKPLTGSEVANIKGKTVFSRLSQEFAATFAPEYREDWIRFTNPGYLKKYMSNLDHREYMFKMPGSDAKSLLLNVDVVERYEGEAASVLLSFIDVTDRIREQLSYQHQLEEALTNAQSASKAKTDFLFNMSHDIRTPMNAIMGFTNMAVKYIDNRERVLECIRKTQEASKLLLGLIDDILDMSRIESGRINIDEKECDVYQSFDAIRSTVEELAQAENISLSFDFGEIKNRRVHADMSRCARVFINLITNAVNYANEGGFVKVKCEQTGEKDGYGIYRYTFEDNGIGMSEEFQKRAFDEFSREKSATVSGIRGTGLGLAVCRAYVNAMGGTIECQSTQGVGSTFTVTLPFRIQDLAESNNASEIISDQEPAEDVLIGRHVLLVEDNELNREIAEDILADIGMTVEIASDGLEAVSIMESKGPDYFDFILMDIQMPVMNGYEATRKIRQMYPDSKIPIIALSANALEEDRIASFTSGMNDHVAKPIELAKLKATLVKYL